MERMIKSLPEKVNEDTILMVYVGKPHTCMCGCAGKYTYSSKFIEVAAADRGYDIEPNEVSDKEVRRVLNRIKNHATDIEDIDSYIYTAIIGKTQYSIYLLESERIAHKAV